ncbi:MAG: glycosyltransferase, partial [Comamonadaceae bacterium]
MGQVLPGVECRLVARSRRAVGRIPRPVGPARLGGEAGPLHAASRGRALAQRPHRARVPGAGLGADRAGHPRCRAFRVTEGATVSANAQRIALVVPVYNEADLITRSLPEILARAREAAPGCRVDLIAVDDGSKDGSRASLAALSAQEPAIHFVSFTRNFGKEAAIHAGLAQAIEGTDAEAVIVIDADLQHPPELMGQMLQHWREGAKVVEAVKRARGDEGPLRRLAARTFYSMFTRMSGLRLDQDTDYKLLDREVVVAAPARGATSNGTCTVGNPSQRTMPRKKRARS